MLELAPRPVDQVQEVTITQGEAALRRPERAGAAPPPADEAPFQDERAARLAALAAAANPSYVRVFQPAPAPARDELYTCFDAVFWSLMAVCVGILGLVEVGSTIVVCAITVWRVP